VYGRPAIAVPVADVQATAVVTSDREEPGVSVHALDIGQTIDLASAPEDEPLSLTVRNVLACARLRPNEVRLSVTIRSTIPVASGLGSGAAVAAALVRALARHLDLDMDVSQVSDLVYETEKIHHGTPSGVDNTVVTYEQPVFFRREQPIETFRVGQPFWLAIADSGLPSVTRETVADVRTAWQQDPPAYEDLFDRIGALVVSARDAIERGEIVPLGSGMNRNHGLLQEMGVSSPVLDALVVAALDAGAHGAKLSGGGRGGNVIALVDPAHRENVRETLTAAGARNVIVTKVG
jgi:mevalonate kinase